MNTWGNKIRLSIFGESHGEAIGIVIDGLEAGTKLNLENINKFIDRRRAGKSSFTTSRKEKDEYRILSGYKDGHTTGAPLCVIFENTNTQSKDYENLKVLLRPNHADYPAAIKFKGFNDIRGGGHFSGRITLALTFAGAVAMDILEEKDRIHKVFPVGRLDKDTEGLMLLTNDGELAHKLISPKKDVEKKYYVEVSGKLKDEYIELVENGIIIDGGYKCKSARLEILESNEEKSRASIFITEGKFHQVKRMMKALGTTVTYLKRLSIGSLKLDENLKLGEYRYLTEKELKNLNK